MMNKSWLQGEISSLKFMSWVASAMQALFCLVTLIALMTLWTPDKDSAYFWVANLGIWFFMFYRRWMKYKIVEFEERLAQLSSSDREVAHPKVIGDSSGGKLYS